MSESANPNPSPDPADALRHVVDDTPLGDESAIGTQDDLQDRLNTRRIQQLAKLRRATMRQRSWHLIAAIVCAVGAIGFARQVVFAAGPATVFWRIGFAAAAIAIAALAVLFFRGTVRLSREMRIAASPQPAPLEPIDFSPLSDGRQLAENLAAMQRHIPEPKEEVSDASPGEHQDER